MTATRDEILSLGGAALRERLIGGHPIDPAALDDTEYRGIALGLPRLIERLTWKTFQKVFYRDPGSGALWGWNVRLRQDGIDAPSVPLVRRGAPRCFGPYRVEPAAGYRAPLPCGQGLMLDYGAGPTSALSPMRDPLVALIPGQVDLLLGWSYVDLGFARIPTPSYFLLERERPLGEALRSQGVRWVRP